MKKKVFKYIKFFMSIVLILSLVAPSYAALSASDGSAFVTKAEFDSALADFNARLTTFEAGINSKIDSQVSSYLDRNGIWNGKVQSMNIDNLRLKLYKIKNEFTNLTPITGSFKANQITYNATATATMYNFAQFDINSSNWATQLPNASSVCKFAVYQKSPAHVAVDTVTKSGLAIFDCMTRTYPGYGTVTQSSTALSGYGTDTWLADMYTKGVRSLANRTSTNYRLLDFNNKTGNTQYVSGHILPMYEGDSSQVKRVPPPDVSMNMTWCKLDSSNNVLETLCTTSIFSVTPSFLTTRVYDVCEYNIAWPCTFPQATTVNMLTFFLNKGDKLGFYFDLQLSGRYWADAVGFINRGDYLDWMIDTKNIAVY